MAVIVPTLRHERRLWNEGLVRVVGVDEVGVAPTCGAVVAAAVIMRPGCHRIPGVRDSKTLSAAQRERLAPLIRGPRRRDRRRRGLGPRDRPPEHLPRHAPRDAPGDRPGRRPRARPRRRQPDRGVRGPGRAVHEHRRRRREGLLDRLRVGRRQGRPRPDDGRSWRARYPGYGWEHNQGYATQEHRDAIRALGLTPFHRRSFLALQRTLAGDQLELDLLADPAASPETHDLLERELVPVMADDAAFDAADLASLEVVGG